MKEQYKSVKKYASDEFTEKRSRFIGYICPVKTEDEALEFIAQIKKKHHDAKHNVYAYILNNGNTERFSDDGEPQGTAGIPVLNVLKKENLTDCVVVVTRYFGGILLGGGGLVRAYSHSAKLAVDASGIVVFKNYNVYKAVTSYADYSKTEALIKEFGGSVLTSDFSENVYIEFKISEEKSAEFIKNLTDITNANVNAELINTVFTE